MSTQNLRFGHLRDVGIAHVIPLPRWFNGFRLRPRGSDDLGLVLGQELPPVAVLLQRGSNFHEGDVMAAVDGTAVLDDAVEGVEDAILSGVERGQLAGLFGTEGGQVKEGLEADRLAQLRGTESLHLKFQ